MKKLKGNYCTLMVWIGFLFYVDACDFFSFLMRKFPKYEEVFWGMYHTCESFGLLITGKYIPGSPKYSLEISQVKEEIHNHEQQHCKSSFEMNTDFLI